MVSALNAAQAAAIAGFRPEIAKEVAALGHELTAEAMKLKGRRMTRRLR